MLPKRFQITGWIGNIAIGLFVSPALFADPGTRQETQSESVQPVLLSPTLGRPAFVKPGGTLSIIAQLPNSGEDITFTLVLRHTLILDLGGPPLQRWAARIRTRFVSPTAEAMGHPSNATRKPRCDEVLISERLPRQRYRLEAGTDAPGRLATAQSITLQLPEGVLEQTYDLEIRCGDVRLVGRHCVAVGRVSDRIRLVHLSNMNIGDVSAPDFDWQLIDEINLVCPTLIVATGDFLDVTHDNPDEGWRRLADFFSRFDAPALIACGDHDDLERYSRFIAPSPVGVIEIGGYRGIVLYDLPQRPVCNDPDQVQWVERTLTSVGDERPAFIVAHDDSPNLLRGWRRRGELARMISATRLGLWFAGGHRDWDGVEYRSLIAAAEPMLYLRTHQSSRATRDGAACVSHYRIVDLFGDRVWLPGSESVQAVTPSLSAGRLSINFDGANDGSRRRIAFDVVNNHAFRLDGLGVRVLLVRNGAQRPWCLGAELEQVRELGQLWECRVGFDLPDKGARRIVVGIGPKPTLPEVEVMFDVSSRLRLERKQTGEGLTYLSRTDGSALIHLRNSSAEAATITPLLRLDGQTLAYVVLDEPGPAATACRLRIAPKATLTLQADLTVIRVSSGRRELQVYLKGPPAWWPACHPLEVVVTPPPPQ